MIHAGLAVIAAVMLPFSAVSAQVRLDDSASPRQVVRAVPVVSPFTAMRPGKATPAPYTARVRNLEILLDTRAYIGRRVRITMSVPLPVQGLQSAGAMRVTWRGGGAFRNGSLVPGTPALVFQGTIDAPLLRGILDMAVQLDPGAVAGPIRFEPVFRIEPL